MLEKNTEHACLELRWETPIATRHTRRRHSPVLGHVSQGPGLAAVPHPRLRAKVPVMATKKFRGPTHSSYARVGGVGASAAVEETGWLAESEEDGIPYQSLFTNLEAPEPDVASRVELVVPPKVFSDFASLPGEAPRPLLVERKRREYTAKLSKLPELIAAHATEGTIGVESMLELEHFDDDEYDIR